MRTIAIKHVRSIDLYDKEQSNRFEYRKAIKILGITFRSEGMYIRKVFEGWQKIENEDIFPLIVIDNVVYYPPYVIIRLIDGTSYSKTFSTIEAASEYYNEFRKIINTNHYSFKLDNTWV